MCFDIYIIVLSNHVPSGALTRSLLPDIAPLPAGLLSTPTGLSWYHASIAPFLESLFSTPMDLLAFIELLCCTFLLSTDPLQAGLFSTPNGFTLYNYIKYMEVNWY